MYGYMHCIYSIPPSLKCFLFTVPTLLCVYFSSGCRGSLCAYAKDLVMWTIFLKWQSFWHEIVPQSTCNTVLRKTLKRNLWTSLNCRLMWYSSLTEGHCINFHVLENGWKIDVRSSAAASKEDNKLYADSRSKKSLTVFILPQGHIAGMSWNLWASNQELGNVIVWYMTVIDGGLCSRFFIRDVIICHSELVVCTSIHVHGGFIDERPVQRRRQTWHEFYAHTAMSAFRMFGVWTIFQRPSTIVCDGVHRRLCVNEVAFIFYGHLHFESKDTCFRN